MNFLLYVFIYIFLVAVWLILNLIFYSISIIAKKNLSAVPYSLNYVINLLLGLYISFYPFYLVWQFIINKEWFLLILIFIAGGFIISILGSIMGLLIAPFNIISELFLAKLGASLDKKEEDFDVEYISSSGKVIEKTSSESKQNKKLAIFFLLSFSNNLLYILLHQNQYHLIGLEYVFTPGFFMLQNAFLFGIPLGIINLLRFRHFIHPTWKVFLTNIFKIELVSTIGFQLLATIYLLLFS